MEPIVVTGVGIISSMGVGKDVFWRRLMQTRSGIRGIDRFATDGLTSNAAGCVRDFDPGRFMPPMRYRRMSRISKMAVAASVEALADSGIDVGSMDRDRIAVVIGTAYGSSSHVDAFFMSLLKNGPRGAQPFLFPETVSNAPASHTAIFHGLTGPNSTFCQNEISAEAAVSYAAALLRDRRVDAALVGGAEELSEILFRCYDALGALNPVRVAPGEVAQPIPAAGLVLGEGAAFLVLERQTTAERRRAAVYGRLEAMAVTGGPCDMGRYEMAGTQMMRAVQSVLDQARRPREDVDALSVSANYSKELDRIEYRCFRDYFKNCRCLHGVTPLKYLSGSFGAGGALRAAAVLLGFRHRMPLPVVALETLAPGFKGPVAWEIPPEQPAATVLMSSATFGGGAAALLFSSGH